jgi:ornithine cyclodeaminase
MRILTEEDVENLIEPATAIDLAATAYRLHSFGHTSRPGRLDLRQVQPKSGALVLASFSNGQELIVKTNVHVYGEGGARRAASMLVVWDVPACAPLAIISATAFNNHRTAAGFAAAARALAPTAARTLAVIGTGKIAPATIRYLAAVRELEQVIIVGRRPEVARELAAAVQARSEFAALEVMACKDSATAVRLADMVATVTTSDQPVFPGTAARAGTFVVLGGANRPDAREADDALWSRARVVVDHLDGCLERAGDLRMALASGALQREQITGEIGELLAGTQAPHEGGVTVFKSIGISPQDATLALWLIEKAKRHSVGTETDLVGGSIRPDAVPPLRQQTRPLAAGQEVP